MRPRGFAFAAALIAFVSLSVSSSAQSFDLRDLLTDFLREGITLAPPPAGFPSHEAHFIGADSPQFQAFEQLNGQIADQLSITEETVKGRVRNILSKLAANDRTHAAMIGVKRGIIEI